MVLYPRLQRATGFLNENASLVEDKRFLGMVEQDTIVHDVHYEIWERFFHPTAL